MNADKIREKLSQVCRELTGDDGDIDPFELAPKLSEVAKWAIVADAGFLTAVLVYGDKLGETLATELGEAD
jgi:hypothetical protein